MRVILFTGKGGVGKTTIAAATAVAAARAGNRTLMLSTDPAHSLADALDVPVPADAAPVAGVDGLFAQQVDPQELFERGWADVRSYLLSLLDNAGFDPIAAEEITVLPGAEEILALLELRRQAHEGSWDVILIDSAPTGETLRLLALPEAIQWYISRTMPSDRRLVRALAPVVGRMTGVQMPESRVAEAARGLSEDLLSARELLTRKGSTVRLVLTPENVVLAESRRALTMLSLHGYRVDGVVANRVFPPDGADEWRSRWVDSQRKVLVEVEQSFGALPIWQSVYQGEEPVGVDVLHRLSEATYGSGDPISQPPAQHPMIIRERDDGWYLSLALPFVKRGDVDVVRKGHELVITVESHRRVLALPSALTRAEVRSAGLRGGRLWVRFVLPGPRPEPEQAADPDSEPVADDRGAEDENG